jgi:hypothetical protein
MSEYPLYEVYTREAQIDAWGKPQLTTNSRKTALGHAKLMETQFGLWTKVLDEDGDTVYERTEY